MHYVALLRAINVGGTGKLPMEDLRAMCVGAGFAEVRTYIASGNVVFESALDGAGVARALETCLATYAGKPVGVMVRDCAEMAAVLAGNPFGTAPGNQVGVLFGAGPLEVGAVRGQADEQIVGRGREIYVWYPSGMGRSKLRFAAMEGGTMRNVNTVAKLVEMLG